MNAINDLIKANISLLTINTILIMSLLILTMGCQNSKLKSDKPVITVSILPQKYFVEKIAGKKFEVNVMIPPGASHENYDPTPEQIINLSNTIVYFRIGNIEFENTWIPKFSENYPDLRLVNLTDNLDLMSCTDNDRHHGQTEPHTWMSPVNVKVIAKTIYETLLELDVQNKSFYTINYNQFQLEIDSITKFVKKQFQDSKSNSFIIYHPALTYYARDFGLKQYSLEVEGKSPSAYHIRKIIDIAKKENIRAILVQKQFDKSKAETIAKETGGKVIEIDPLNENWAQEITDITWKLSEAFHNH
jgi:zinc transport system substrate-binding protein